MIAERVMEELRGSLKSLMIVMIANQMTQMTLCFFLALSNKRSFLFFILADVAFL